MFKANYTVYTVKGKTWNKELNKEKALRAQAEMM
jgi:hypothetical protein